MTDPVADAASKPKCVVLRPAFPAWDRPSPNGKLGVVLAFRPRHTPTNAETQNKNPELLPARLTGDIEYEVLQRSLLDAGLVLKQDRDGLLITRQR